MGIGTRICLSFFSCCTLHGATEMCWEDSCRIQTEHRDHLTTDLVPIKLNWWCSVCAMFLTKQTPVNVHFQMLWMSRTIFNATTDVKKLTAITFPCSSSESWRNSLIKHVNDVYRRHFLAFCVVVFLLGSQYHLFNDRKMINHYVSIGRQ